MSSQPPVDADREYRLIEQLELRVANANTEEKFQTVVQKFLAALVLKVGSEHARNRNLAIKVCQHISQRLKLDNSIALPIQSLFKTFRESQSAFVSNFALIFIEQGLIRLPANQRLSVLPEVLQGSIPTTKEYGTVQGKMFAVALGFLLEVLRTWRVPGHNTKEDAELKTTFNLTDYQNQILSLSLSNFISYEPKTKTSWKPILPEFDNVFQKYTKSRSEVIVALARFLFTSVFNDEQRIATAILLSVDTNESASSVSDTMFKQCNFDFEQDSTVTLLFDLFGLDRPKLQIRILSLLTKSQKSTDRVAVLLSIVEQELFRKTTGLEAAKLRSAVFQYLNWAVRVGNALGSIRSRLQSNLRDFIELQGWPTMTEASNAEADLRAKAYESIGLLATIKPSDSDTSSGVSMDLITWLFTSLRCDTTRDVRASVDEALSRIINVIDLRTEDDVRKMKALLLWNVRAEEGDQDPVYYFNTVYSTRYLAVRFANKVLPYDDVDARYIDVVAVGFKTDRREIAEEGIRGLDPYWHTTNAKLANSQDIETGLLFPSFGEFVTRTFGEQSQDLQISSISTAVHFGSNLLKNEALKNSPLEVESGPEWSRKLDAATSNDPPARTRLQNYINQVKSQSIIDLLNSAIYGMSTGSVLCADVASDLLSLCSTQSLHHLNPDVLSALQKASINNSVQFQATRCYGIISSLSPKADVLIDEALVGCTRWSSAVGQEVVSVCASMLNVGSVLSRLSLRQSDIVSTDLVGRVYALMAKIVISAKDKSLKHAAYTVIGQLCLCIPPNGFSSINMHELMDTIFADAKKEDEAAVLVLGRITNLIFINEESEVDDLLERLFNLHEVRKAELHLALGEAFATAALGFRSRSTLSEFDVDATRPAWGFHPDLYIRLVNRAINDAKTTKPSLKKASAIWLLSLIQYCDDTALLKPHLRDCQVAFGKLLNDRDEVVQETGSRGLGLVYEKGDKSLQEDLVRDLVQSFTGGGAKLSGTISEDTQLFEAGALPTEGGQSVQTYKDIVSLATEMGDPSLVYRFMNLASNNAIWTSRAAFGRFGLSGVLADSTYLAENKKFYPKLFRYRFDPNPNVQRSMDEIWKALVKDPNKVLDENYDLIMTDLLKSIVSGKEWRAREASCAAISDLVQGREVDKFEPYLNEIWNVAFKVLDDVKESVRVAAMKLCRTLTSMLIRNLEVGGGTTKRATTMMQHALPFLLQQMENGSAQEVQQYAIITLLEIVKKSPLRSLRAFAPQVLERLVLSLSSLEHESINYLHLNADKYGLTAEKLDKMRVSSINASPVSEAIERCLDSLFVGEAEVAPNTNYMEGQPANTITPVNPSISPVMDAMQRLEAAFKTAIGLPSKVGLSRVMVTLVVRHHVGFRPYADRFLQLTRKSIVDRNATISISFSMALGYLVRLTSTKEVNETSRYAQGLYFESQELSHRAIAGEIIQAISKASNDVFLNFASTLLPFAFIGRNDLDPDVRNRFDPPWKDNVGGSRALNLYLSEIVVLISKHITSSLWPIRQACCLAVAELVSSMHGTEQYSDADARLLWSVMEEALNGKTWDGKEKVIQAYPTFVQKSRSLWAERGKRMNVIAVREANRNNVGYRRHALTALGEIATTRSDLELNKEVFKVVTQIIEQLEEQEDAMDVDGGEDPGSSARHTEATYTAVIECVFRILTPSTGPESVEQSLTILRRAYGKISAKIDIGIYDGARRYITQSAQKDSSSSETDTQARVSGKVLRSSQGGRQADHRNDHDPQHEQEQAASASFSFLHGLVLAVFRADDCDQRHASDNEATRKSRVSAALALAESDILSAPTRKLLLDAVHACMRAERSRPLKMDLERAVNLLQPQSLGSTTTPGD